MTPQFIFATLAATCASIDAQERPWSLGGYFVAMEAPCRADLSGLPEDVREVLFAGDPTEDLSVTAAMLWALVAQGNPMTKGPHQKNVSSMVSWLKDNAFGEPGDDELARGEALAAGVLEVISRIDSDQQIAQPGRERLLRTQTDDGGWIVDGLSAEDPRSLEATGWATWALRLAAHAEPSDELQMAYARGRDLIDSFSEDETAAAFDLYFDVCTGDKEGARRFGETYDDTYLATTSPTIGLIATATAWNLGGATWKRWEKSLTRRIVLGDQILAGPAKGFWPASEDPRGALWDLGLRLQVQLIYYRFGESGL